MDKKKKRAIAFVVILFILVALEIVYIFSELYTESEIPGDTPVNKDALKFKSEYESVNGTTNSLGIEYRNLTINEDNPFIYATAEDIVKKIENKETFVVYFGFNTCPWCRSVISSLIDSAKDNNIKEIYYVDVLNIRDKYELNEKNKAVRTVEGTEGYYKLLELMNNVLDDYSPLTYKVKKKTKKVVIKEKRIYAPNVVVVKEGEAIYLESGIVDELTDNMMELSEGLKCKIKEAFNCLFDSINEKVEECDLNALKC